MPKIFITLVSVLTMSSAAFASAVELCEWFPSGRGGQEKTYLCIQKLSATRGTVSIKSSQGSRTCDASIRGRTWTSRCKISTDIQFDGLSLVSEESSLEFSVYELENPETNAPSATLDFHSPEHGINGWKRWNLNAE